MEEEITLFVHDNVDHIQKVVVRSSETVESLGKIANTQGKFLCFFNGSLLLGSFSFKYYNLTNGDHIYTSESQSLQAYSYIGKQVQSLRNEAERLKDILFQKIEGSSTYSRKLMNRFNQFLSHQEKNFDDPPTKAPKESREPNVEALPSLWEKTAPVLC